MTQVQPVGARGQPAVGGTEELDLTTALAVILEGWRTVVGVAVPVAITVLGLLLLQPRKYKAALTLTPVASAPFSSTGLAATLLAGGASGGLQPTPPFIDELTRLPGVLTEVAEAPVTATAQERIIERIARTAHADSIPTTRVPEVMSDLIKTTIHRETGTITVEVQHRDSGLARAIAQRLIEVVTRTFINATKAQASELRRAQALRVDSASVQLARAEQALVAYLSGNRTISPYTRAAVERDRLQRAIDIAQQAYVQAMSDRNNAIAQELQETPAVVVIDPLPGSLPPVPRHRALKLGLIIFLTIVLVAFVLVSRESRRLRTSAEPDSGIRLRMAVAGVPVLRRVLRLGRRN